MLGVDEIFGDLMRLPGLTDWLRLTVQVMRRTGVALRMLALTEPVLMIFPDMVTPGKHHF